MQKGLAVSGMSCDHEHLWSHSLAYSIYPLAVGDRGAVAHALNFGLVEFFSFLFEIFWSENFYPTVQN